MASGRLVENSHSVPILLGMPSDREPLMTGLEGNRDTVACPSRRGLPEMGAWYLSEDSPYRQSEASQPAPSRNTWCWVSQFIHPACIWDNETKAAVFSIIMEFRHGEGLSRVSSEIDGGGEKGLIREDDKELRAPISHLYLPLHSRALKLRPPLDSQTFLRAFAFACLGGFVKSIIKMCICLCT